VRIEDPAADLAVALAVASAVKRVALSAGGGDRPLACFGELGLTGELRPVAHGDRRLAEAEKFGLVPVIEPEAQKTLQTALRAVLNQGGAARAVAA
jgi:DNA repair protein RadA/Sms